MKIIKILIITLMLLLMIIGGARIYLAATVATELNTKYANKQLPVSSIDKNNYFIGFDQIISSRSITRIAWKILGWKEESSSTIIVYNFPIEFGYDLLTQKCFIHYNGDITASYKPAKHGFGSRINIENYNIEVDIPLDVELFKVIAGYSDPSSIVNHILNAKVSTDKVEIFDLIDNEKFYDKEYERVSIGFEKIKNYENLTDFLSNIPQKYNINYAVKTKSNSFAARRVPASLFYGFFILPADLDFSMNAVIETKSNNFHEFMKEINIKAYIDYKSKYIDLSAIDMLYESKNYNREFTFDISSKITTKSGLYDYIFETYEKYSSNLFKYPLGAIVNRDINYIMQNKESFRPLDFENNSFYFNLKLGFSTDLTKKYLKIEDFNIQSAKSGIRLCHEMESNLNLKKGWFAKGIIYLTSYKSVIEFCSGFIYKFDKFRFLNSKARKLYADLNKVFLKNISDHPESSSEDISFEYDFDSNSGREAKIGSMQVRNLKGLYDLTLYQLLFDTVGYQGDVLAKMREILPELDGHEPILANILSRISTNKYNER